MSIICGILQPSGRKSEIQSSHQEIRRIPTVATAISRGRKARLALRIDTQMLGNVKVREGSTWREVFSKQSKNQQTMPRAGGDETGRIRTSRSPVAQDRAVSEALLPAKLLLC